MKVHGIKSIKIKKFKHITYLCGHQVNLYHGNAILELGFNDQVTCKTCVKVGRRQDENN